MNTRYILGLVLVIALIVIGVAVYQSTATSATSPTPAGTTGNSSGVETTNPDGSAATSTSTSSGSTGSSTSYTIAQVAQHNSASSCWAAINGNVYDLTAWINEHPGGPEHILGICGTDASAVFNTQHGGQAQPMQELQQFYIGTFAS